jgi:hypothetical protein
VTGRPQNKELDSKTIIEAPHVIDAQEKVHTAHAKLNQLVLRISMKVIIPSSFSLACKRLLPMGSAVQSKIDRIHQHHMYRDDGVR